MSLINFALRPNKGDFERATGAWRGTIDAEKLMVSIYADRLVATLEVPKL
jgi:hypothetical protein